VSWEGVKGLMSPAQKRDPAFVEQAKRIWVEYEKGRINLQAAQSRIYDLAGGVTTPEWAR
jgi:hypothetical protein